MMTPTFQSRLVARDRPLFGLWQALACSYTAEICAGAGYDWLLFDGEHAPNTIPALLQQLQAVARFPVEPIGRVPVGDPVYIKQYLDIGFATLLVPMVESADQARGLVAATRFPPKGVRGVASATSRASGFGADANYLAQAHEKTCLIVQIESRAGLDALDAIAETEGVDAIFIGPGDLAASLGHLGNPRHPNVRAAITDAVVRVKRAGKAVGIFALDADDGRHWIGEGVGFLSVGTDVTLLAASARNLLAAAKEGVD